jgi:hypothetical protein
MRRALFLFLILALSVPCAFEPTFAQKGALHLTLPNEKDSVKFVSIGDTGTGGRPQIELANIMAAYHNIYPFEFVIMAGDNIYGSEKPTDMKRKFEDVYRPLLDRGVKFYASLGNHDDTDQRFYPLFNMGGEEYYRFQKGGASFYALNSVDLEKPQIEWFERELAKDDSKWKIAFFHHPAYSSGGRHGSSERVRRTLEPIFIRYGVDIVFSGHDHIYERIKPQNGIQYFVTGAGGKLRKGNVEEGSTLTETAFDADLSFLMLEITDGRMHFQAISRTGQTVDSGSITRRDP